MGLMSQALIDALIAGKTRACIMEWTMAGTTRRYSKDGIAAPSYPYPQSVLSFGGESGNVLSLLSGRNLADDTRHVTLFEQNGDITKIIFGEDAEKVVGSSVVLKLMAEDVDEENWFTWYTGEVADYGRDGPGRWTLTLQPPYADQLSSRIKTPILTPYDFPDADDAVKNKSCPLIWGIHDSLNTGRDGLLTALSVDTVNDYFLPSHGRTQAAGSTYNVWDDGTLKTVTTHYTIENITRGGRVYTVIAFLSTPTGPVTFDIEGMTDDGTGSGATLTNIAEQLKFLLANWVFDEVTDTSGYTIPADGPVEENSFDLVASFLSRSGDNSSRYLTGDETAESLINDILSKKNLFGYWTNLGKFALAHCDWFVDDIYDSALPWFSFGQRGVGQDLGYQFLTSRRYDEISAKHLYSSSDGDFLEQLRVIDPDAGLGSKLDLNLFWSKASE